MSVNLGTVKETPAPPPPKKVVQSSWRCCLTSEPRAESAGSFCGSWGSDVEPGPGQGFYLVNLTEMYSEYPAACERIECLGQISELLNERH